MKVGSVQQSHFGPEVGYLYRLSTSAALSKNELFKALAEKELEESTEMVADQATGLTTDECISRQLGRYLG